jgi:hypothetical protein
MFVYAKAAAAHEHRAALPDLGDSRAQGETIIVDRIESAL